MVVAAAAVVVVEISLSVVYFFGFVLYNLSKLVKSIRRNRLENWAQA